MLSSSRKSLTNSLAFNIWLPKEEKGENEDAGGTPALEIP